MGNNNGVVSMTDERLGTVVELTAQKLTDAHILLHGLMEINNKLPGKVVQMIHKNIKRLDKQIKMLDLGNKERHEENEALDKEYLTFDGEGRKLVWNKESGIKGYLGQENGTQAIFDAEGKKMAANGAYTLCIEPEERYNEYAEKKKELNNPTIKVRVLKFANKDFEKLDVPMRGGDVERGIPPHPLDVDSFFTNFVHGEKDEEVIETRKRDE